MYSCMPIVDLVGIGPTIRVKQARYVVEERCEHKKVLIMMSSFFVCLRRQS